MALDKNMRGLTDLEKKAKQKARKQVSSHLQVLKKKFENEPTCESKEIMMLKWAFF